MPSQLPSFQSTPQSWASVCSGLAQVEEKIKLDLFPHLVVNDLRIVEIPDRVVDAAVKNWAPAVVCYSPNLKVGAEGIRRYALKNWKLQGDMNVYLRANGFVIIRFAVEEDRRRVLCEGPWFLNGQVLISRPWELGP